MRGRPTKTPERVAEARRLRESGLTYSEVARRLGVARTTAHAWISDPDGSAAAARKDSYRGTCETCGGSTTGCEGPGKAPTQCTDCLHWTREAVLEAFADWFAEHAEPPRTADVRRYPGRLPHHPSVARLFGSWASALEEAGMPVVCDRRPEGWAEVRARIAAGESPRALADERGCTVENIYGHLQRHGVAVGRSMLWSPELVVEAMRRWAVEHGRLPKSSDWRLAGEGHPNYVTTVQHLGSWRAAIEAASAAVASC